MISFLNALARAATNAEPANAGPVLAVFEPCHAATHPQPFWILFETTLPETPRVDF